jgi:SnoaL-like domain
MKTRDERIDEMLGRLEVMDAMARYSRGIDRRDEELLKSVYHEDSVDDHGFGLSAGGWEIAALVRRDGAGFPDEWRQTSHLLGQHLIEVDGDSAESEVYFVASAIYEHDDVDWAQISAGRYLDQWERRAGAFKIARRTVVYDWVRTDRIDTRWPGPDHDVAKMYHGGAALPADRSVYGSPGPDDASYSLLDMFKNATVAQRA